MKKLKYLIILLFIFIGINSVSAFDTSLKIYDYAMKLTNEEEKILKTKVDNFINTYKMDMVLVTVKNHQKSSTKAYAEDFYDYNGFGLNSTYDGIIFVIDFTFGYTDIYISTTGEAIRMYDDYRINSMLDNIEYAYNIGFYNMFESFISDASNFASQGIPSSNQNVIIDENGDPIYQEPIPWLTIIIISLIVPSIVLLIFIKKNKMVKKSISASEYLKQGSVIINIRNDKFITTHTTSIRINTDSSSGSSGRVGGSSVSRGSSGRSHGGGGRRL